MMDPIQVSKNGQLKFSYTFDATNMMVGATSPAKGEAEYTYNGFRHRVAMLESFHSAQTAMPDPVQAMPGMASTPVIGGEAKQPGVFNYVLDMTLPYDNLLAVQGAANQTFTWGNSLLSVTGAGSSQTHHYLQDHLGSPIRLLHSGSAPDTTMVYDEFGVLEVAAIGDYTQQNGSIHNPFGYTGYQTDSISGLYYAQARFYDPTIARFTAEDVVRDGANWYAYCHANPLGLVDKNGLWPEDTHHRITRLATENLRGFEASGICLDALMYYNYATDSVWGPTSFLPFVGNQNYHFNGMFPRQGDTRRDLAEFHLQKAIGLWTGTITMEDVEAFNAGIPCYMKHRASMRYSANSIGMRNEIPTGLWSLEAWHRELDRTFLQELALANLGMGLHALQDMHAHGHIGAGRRVITGHMLETLGSWLWSGPDPDSYNYEWRVEDWIEAGFFLVRTTVEEPRYNNPRILGAVADSEAYLRRFMMAVGLYALPRRPIVGDRGFCQC